ncbi:Bifunctional lysine-specific demethylase and histidyl-hydroxylase [Heracleum sosnowskyi]|uniref:Bifunctional lysine-specific demethylase and histidyl-hydroxylase n=1 Tax=Heracleum sosnowskyi TaxID=360622 RepID=A0AAD8N2K4_9APIA|nr:Bifunctional lysine-specific demethylase and histidyl-hydroxylase [Heracleum sosnowskyi]
MDSPCSSCGSNSTELQKKFTTEKRDISYVDLHSQVKNDVNTKPPSSGIHRRQHGRSKGLQKEELVKYMSKLPNYLEKGEKVKAKPLNLGVLDWHSLENWQNYHLQKPSSRCSTSGSITSSSLWTDELSNHYGKGDDTCSPSQKERRPSLQSYLNISPIEGHAEHVQSSAWNAADTDIRSKSSEFKFPTKSSEIKLKECKRENFEFCNSKTRSSGDFKSSKGLSSSKGKLKVQGDVSTKESEKLQNQCSNSIHHAFPNGYKDVVLPMPKHGAESNHSRPLNLTRKDQELKVSSAASSDKSHLEEVYSTELYPSISGSCAVTHEIDGRQQPHVEQNFSCSPSCAIKSASRATNMMHINLTSTKSSTILKMKSTDPESEAQNPSPSRRLSFVLNRIRSSYNFRNSSDVPQFRSEDVTARSAFEIADPFVCPNGATCDQYNASRKENSSALKRLLNPLLKTKVANFSFADQSQNNSTSTRRMSTSFDEQGELSSVHPLKVKLQMTNLRTPNLDKTHHDKVQGSPILQAYFQVSSKDDLPVFTFAVDNSRDILAATLRKFSSRKNDGTWIYTFFSIQDTRRKSGGWLNQGSKGKDYVPNVVAQMKVSDLSFSNLGQRLTVDQLSTREFVLYAVDLRYQICDVQANDELAAIVVKFPRKILTSLEDSTHNVRCSSYSRNLQEDRFSTESQEHFSTTVLLPGGNHGLPSKGEPSPLIERWLSGGQCDCGGWDLGCKVKVFANKNKKPNGQFELFSQSQDETQQPTPFFTLSSLKNGIFSVEFSSNLSALQAFSICVAVSDSTMPSELQQASKFVEKELAEETTLPDDCGLRTPKLVGVDVPARFVTQPPHSPVGRV